MNKYHEPSLLCLPRARLAVLLQQANACQNLSVHREICFLAVALPVTLLWLHSIDEAEDAQSTSSHI